MADPGPIDYGEIGADYAFFLAHSTETAAQLAALGGHVGRLAGLPPPARLLDFGCGTGAFTQRLLTAAGLAPGARAGALAIWLVEPVAAHRDAAAARLAPLAREVVQADSDAAWQAGPRFDMILANHSLYYVPDPEAVVGRLLGALAPGGRLVAALLDRDNALARLWRAGYAAAGAAFPFLLAEDLEVLLGRHGIASARETVGYRIAFQDGPRQRSHVLRFLFGPQLAALPTEAALALFDPYRCGRRIVIETNYPHLVVQAER